jgi:hypothetical protein
MVSGKLCAKKPYPVIWRTTDISNKRSEPTIVPLSKPDSEFIQTKKQTCFETALVDLNGQEYSSVFLFNNVRSKM